MRPKSLRTDASQPTSQPNRQVAPITRCATCVHRYEIDHDCSVHTAVELHTNTYCIITECSGYQAAVVNHD